MTNVIFLFATTAHKLDLHPIRNYTDLLNTGKTNQLPGIKIIVNFKIFNNTGIFLSQLSINYRFIPKPLPRT